MTIFHSLPPGLRIDAGADTSAEELAEVWALTAAANPLAALPAPDPARMQAMLRTLTVRRLVRTKRYLAIAASIALLIATGLFATSRPVHLTAIATLDTELPDGSTVSMSPQTELVYHRRFGRSHRRLSMEGVVLFDVRTGELPFIVEAPGLTITVEGTKFSVDAAGEVATVFVTEGIITVTAHGVSQHLAAGEGARVETATGDITPLTADSKESEELFIHIKQPLGVMFDAVESLFGIEVVAEEQIRSHVHNFKHEVTTVESLISDLCRSVTSMTLRYRATATGFEILEE